jgi:branched-chain amino acid transport system permease protein
MRPNWQTLILLAGLILVASAPGYFGTGVMQRFAIDMMVKLVFVIGLSIFVSNTGVLSFGHAAFAAIGAYAAAWFTIPPITKRVFLPELPAFVLASDLGFWGGMAVGVGIAAAAALAIGLAVVRLAGIGASIATLAFLAIVYTTFSNADWLTKGTASLIGLPLAVGLPTATAVALAALAIAYFFAGSPMGLMLQASREDEAAASASGIAVRPLRLAAFVLSAAVVAASGVLQGHAIGVLSVGQFYLELTFLTLAMLVIGGQRSLSGAVIGAILISFLAELLRTIAGGVTVFGLIIPPLPGLREVGLAIIMLAVLMIRPRGVTGNRELSLSGVAGWLRWRRVSEISD